MQDHDGAREPRTTISRRSLLAGAAAFGALGFTPVGRLTPADAEATCAPPPALPDGIEVFQQTFENWSRRIHVEDLWTCAPRDAEDVVALANWAAEQGWTLRPRGASHTWAPVHVSLDTDCGQRTLLVATGEHLVDATVLPGVPAAVQAQPGILMQDLLALLEEHGLGLANCPAPGELTLGGVLAVGGHGTSVPAVGETPQPGKTYGSISNLVLSLDAVVWTGERYELHTFDRAHPHTKALLTNLGRTFVTSVTLQVGANDNLRCRSYVDVPASELFAAPGTDVRTFASYVEATGRAETIHFAFTEHPWLKTWEIAPTQPEGSREVTEPYNYPFSDNIPAEMSSLAEAMVTGNPESAPVFGRTAYEVCVAGLTATDTFDLWGPSKNTLLYVRSTTLRSPVNGYLVLTSRDQLQRVVHDFNAHYEQLLQEHADRGEYPINMPLEIRVSGLDHPSDVLGLDAEAPSLSALSPRADHPEWDTGVWFNAFSMLGTPGADAFFAELEAWVYEHFTGWADVRVEWSKGWAYTADGPWTDEDTISTRIPAGYRAGRSRGEDWDWAVRRLDELDPARVFTNPFLDRLLV